MFLGCQIGQGFVNLKNDKVINYSDTRFQLNESPPLEVLSLRRSIFQTLSVFSVKFTRIKS